MRPAVRFSARAGWFACLLGGAVLLAYCKTFSVPFVFDDVAAVTQNPSITRLSSALAPPPGLSVTGRPLVNLSLACNYAFGREEVWGYHAVNLALHLANTLLLFAFLRATLATRPHLLAGADPDFLAFVACAVWALHPLPTAAVTYIMQRSELLVSACYLATLSAFRRALSSRDPSAPPTAARGWLAASVAACGAGMACKEVMATAPLAVLLYDRTFAARSFAGALRARRAYYAGLAATWLILGALILGTDNRGASAGLASAISWIDYGLTQVDAAALYVRLAVWPSPLVFDYGAHLVRDPLALLLGGLLVAPLVVATVAAIIRGSEFGFAAGTSLLLLAPTTSLVPIATQTIGEHRVYLALAFPLAALVVAAHRWTPRAPRLVLGIAVLFGVLTFDRNTDYRSAARLWADTVAKHPGNARAHYNLGVAQLVPGPAHDPARAALAFAEALRLQPNHAQAPAKLGAALLATGKFPDAIAPLASAVRLQPDDATLNYQLAGALLATGRVAEAVPHLAESARRQPNQAAVRYNYGRALTDLGRYEEALVEFEAAARLDPADSSAPANAARLRSFLGK